jgi:hypothetical protein
MAQIHDYIPKTDGDLMVFARNLNTYAAENYEKWKVPSSADFLEALITTYDSVLAVFNDPNHGKVDTKNKNDAKNALVKALRTYIQGYITRNPLVTDEDKEKMSLPLRDTTPTAHPVPEERPETEAVPQGKGTHRVTAINPDTHNKDKPRLVTGVAFARRIRKPDESASRADDMPSEFQAGTSRLFQYAEADYGKVVDYAAAYENGSGKRGPWSNVTSLLISG